MKNNFVIIIFLAISVYIDAQLFGSNFPNRNAGRQRSCQFNRSNKYGTCRKYSECRSVQIALKNKRIQPTICYFDRFDPIVCCESESIGNRLQPQIKQTNKSEEYCKSIYGERDSEPVFLQAVGGVEARKDEFPLMAAVGWKVFENDIDFHCGGFLITKRFIATAAHCSTIGGAKPDYARIGGVSLNSTQIDNSVDIPIERVYVHPQYKSKENYNDIAVMKLTRDADYNPGCLWKTHEIRPRFDSAEAIGYGHTKFAGARSSVLIKVKLKIYPEELCSQTFKPDTEIPRGIISSQLCAGDPQGVMDTCQGDSGGPILVKQFGIPYVLGITSFGEGCASGSPSIYTRISSYIDWIESIVWP